MGQRELINVRPEVREYSVLHQAAYHGSEETVNTRIDKYGADAVLRTKSGELITDIAKNQGHQKLSEALTLRFSAAARLSDHSDLTPEKETPPPKKQKVSKASSSDDLEAKAHALIDLAKNGSWDE